MKTEPASARCVVVRAACLTLACLLCALPLAGCGDAGGAPSGNGDARTPAPAPVSAAAPVAQPTAAPAPAPAPALADAGLPEITFDKTSYDFGAISDADKCRTTFAFTNTGKGRLIISEVKAACGCTVPTLSRYEFMPGEGDVIDVVFNPKGKDGDQAKTITVVSNAQTPQVTLELHSQIKPMLVYERMYKLGDLALGQEHRQILKFFYTDPELEIKKVAIVNNPSITAEVVETDQVESASGAETTYRAAVELTVAKDAPWGLVYATRLTLDVKGRPRSGAEPIETTYDVYVSGNVFGTIKANPSIVGLGRLAPGEDFEKTAILTRTGGQPFAIVETSVIDSNMPGIKVRTEPRENGEIHVIIHGNVGTYDGSIRGTVRVKTDIPGEETLEIRFSGFVKA